jgi:hypothetical protein
MMPAWSPAREADCRKLQWAGYNVVGPVPSSAQALQVMAEERIDAAVLDVRLGACDPPPRSNQSSRPCLPWGTLTNALPARSIAAALPVHGSPGAHRLQTLAAGQNTY